MRVSRLARAETWLARAEAIGPKNPRTALLRARLDRKRGLFPSMEEHLRRAATLGCRKPIVASERLLAELQSGLLRPVDPRVSNLFMKGEVDTDEASDAYALGCLRNYEFAPAQMVLVSWEADYPQDPRPNFYRGRILEHANSFGKAADEYRAASKKAGGAHAPSEYSLARVAIENHDDDEAIRCFERCQKGLDDPAPALLGEAAALRRVGRTAEAEAILLSKAFDDRSRLASQLIELGEPFERARAAYEAERGLVALAGERYAEAETWLVKALAEDPQDWKLRNQYATALGRLGKSTEAAEQFRQVAATEKAVARCDQLLSQLKKNPADADARYEIGMIYFEHISRRQGEAWLRTVLQYDPAHAGALKALGRL